MYVHMCQPLLSVRNPNQAETELLMRRKEFLDEVHQVFPKSCHSTIWSKTGWFTIWSQKKQISKSFSEGDWDCWARTDAETRNLLIWKVFICTGFLIQIQYKFVKSDFSIAFICHYPFVLHSKNHSRSACHLQLGRDLYDRKKFGKEVFSSSSLRQWFWFLNEKIWVGKVVLW